MILIKNILIALVILSFWGCKENTGTGNKASDQQEDTILIKKQTELTGYAKSYYIRSYSYSWIAAKDTIDLRFNVSEHIRDSSVSISVWHTNPISFTVMLHQFTRLLPKIEKDFSVAKISSLYFKPPIYYPELATSLSKEYEQQFGRKNISFQKQKEFLLTSSLNTQLNKYLNQFGKKAASYSIEKFHLAEKEHYSLPDTTDLTNYPEFSIHGHGISVLLTTL